jgi:hypothetical protein
MFDPGTEHWFVSFLYIGFCPAPTTCGKAGSSPLADYGYEFILVSTTDSPLRTWNVYAIDVTDPSHPNCPCLGDQPLLGADQNSIILSTNEFPIFAAGFNGAQVYLVDKHGLSAGFSSVSFVSFNLGALPTPDGSCQASGGIDCWYSVSPGASPTPGSWDTSNGGTAWAMSSLDFTGGGDNRIAVWSFSNTESLHDSTPKIKGTVFLGEGLEKYFNPGLLVPQREGLIPLGDVVYSDAPNSPTFGCTKDCPEGGLASNGDGMFAGVSYAQEALWGAISTLVNVGTPYDTDFQIGEAFWIVNAAETSVSLANQGYIATSGAGILFPSIAAGPTGVGVIVFSLAGPANYPSTAYSRVGRTSSSTVNTNIFIAAKGQSPQDGFTEYQCLGNPGACSSAGLPPYRPRWGDYSWAVWSNGKVFFASEYIQSPNCSDGVYAKDPFCGGTRDPFANWGTSLNSVVP